MKEYLGAVFFVDILGVGALTRGLIDIKKSYFKCRKLTSPRSLIELHRLQNELH